MNMFRILKAYFNKYAIPHMAIGYPQPEEVSSET